MKEDLLQAIDIAAKGDLAAVGSNASRNSLTDKAYHPQPGGLSEYYSLGEKVVCSILLDFYFEMNGRPAYVDRYGSDMVRRLVFR